MDRMDKEAYPALSNVWIIICGEYGLPRDTPMPELPKQSVHDLELAEYHAKFLTMGNISKWLKSESFACHSALLDIMQDMWHEVDNL